MRRSKLFGFMVSVVIALLVIVIPAKPVQATSHTVSVFPNNGAVGTLVTITGTGFTAGETYAITFGYGSAFAQLVVPTTGIVSTTFSAMFTIPSVPRGSYTIQTITTTMNFSTLFTITPKITLGGAIEGNVGDQVSVSGNGFSAGSTIDIYFDDNSAGTVTSSSNGTFTNATFTIPESHRGSHAVKGRDAAGFSPALGFTTLHEMTVVPTSADVGEQITISGTGFTASSNITFYIDDIIVTTDVITTNTSGSFINSAFVIPPSAQGSHTLKATDGGDYSSTEVLVIGHKMTSMTPTSGILGTIVTLTGSGFSANASITIRFNGVPVTTDPAIISVNATGSFTGSFAVPAASAGTYPVEATDGVHSVSADFESTIDATISQMTTIDSPGYVGMELTISGTGFKPDATVTITYTSDPVVLATVTTDGSGSFSVTVTIPPSIGGEHTIVATDDHTTKQFTFVMEVEAPPVPSLLLPEMGIKAEQPVYFDWDDVTDTSGGVTYTLQVATAEDFTEDSIVLEKKELIDTEYTVTEEEKLLPVKEEAPYYWRVRAIDDAANASDWAGAESFHIGFLWPKLGGWLLYVLMGVGGLLLLAFGFWLGRRTAYY